MAARPDDGDASSFAAKRLLETERLIADASAWIRQLRAQQSGDYPGAAEVDQYRLAMKTDELAGKLGSIEQTLVGLLQRQDGTLPKPIAEKARSFLADMDKQAAPNQFAAVYALHSKKLDETVNRQHAAEEALTAAQAHYDEMIRLAIAEMDKLPVEDPISQLLEDPTLDELLAQLEQELPLAELLGIPLRPSNLQIVKDWLAANSGGSGGSQMAANQVHQEQRRSQQSFNRAYRQALARALKETQQTPKIEISKTGKLSDWNRLVSRLSEDLRQGRGKAPPEKYRRAIEQYFEQISETASTDVKPENSTR